MLGAASCGHTPLQPIGRVGRPTRADRGVCAAPWDARDGPTVAAMAERSLSDGVHWSPAGRRASAGPAPSGWPRPAPRSSWSTGTPRRRRPWPTQVGGTAVAVDLSDLDAVDALDLAVDILVNNAGLQHVAPLHEFPVDRFSYILRLMLEAPFRLVRGALPHMYEQGWGRVVNISSVHGLRASPYKSAYVTAKHGLEGLSKVIALEGAAHGVTSNCVNPAYVRTPLVEGQIADQAEAHGLSRGRGGRAGHAGARRRSSG